MRKPWLFVLAVLSLGVPAHAQVVSQGRGGTSAWSVKFDGTQSVEVIGSVTFSNTTLAVTNTGTFAVQATLAEETTKVIGTVNIAAAQSVNVDTVTTLPAITFAAPQHVICDSGCLAGSPGQQTMANSFPVVIASDQGAISVAGPLTNAELRATPVPISGSVTTGGLTDAELRATAVPVSLATAPTTPVTGTFWQETQPVSGAISFTAPQHTITDTGSTTEVTGNVAITAVSLPLPSGASLESTQSAISSLILATAQGNGVTTGSTPRVTLSSDSTGQLGINQWLGSTNPTVGSKTSANSLPVVIASDQGAISVTGPLTDTQLRATAVPVSGTTTAANPSSAWASVTSVSASASSVSLLASNATRKFAMFFNDSTAALYLKFGGTASLTSFTVKLVGGAYYEIPLHIYTGAIDGIWDSATGAVRITEMN